MKKYLLLIIIFLLIGFQFRVFCEQQSQKKVKFNIGEVKSIKSSLYKKTKNLQIFLPKNYKFTHTKYPVLFVLDGNVHFHYTTGIISLISGVEIPSLIVVGIPNGSRFDDATPSKDPKYPKGGGAEKYIVFLKKEVIPFIDKNYRTNNYKILSGHSLDGLTVVYSFLYHSELFNAYIANSPSLWWHEKKMVKNASKAPVFNSEKLSKSKKGN